MEIMKKIQNNVEITPLVSEIEQGQVQEQPRDRTQERSSIKIAKKKFDAYIDHQYFDTHWNEFKKVIDFYYPTKDYKKYYIALRSFFSYFSKPKTTIVLGEYSEHLIKGILKLHPEKYVLCYEGVDKIDLVSEEWKDKRLVYYVYFDENKEIIYNRYMRNVSEFRVRTRKGSTIIPNKTLITRAKKELLPKKFRLTPNVIELSNLESHVKELALSESTKQGKRLEYNKKKTSIVKIGQKLQLLIEKYNCEFHVEVVYYEILRSSFKLRNTILPYKEFLDLIKVITFFNQNFREWYEDKITNKKYLLAHPSDFVIAYEIALHIFSVPIPNLTPVKQHFFNFIVKKAKEKKKRSELPNISLFDIQLEQSKIINDYPGNKSTLILWLKKFCDDLRILTRTQYKKNAKIYFSLNKIAPLASLDFTTVLDRIKKTYKSRVLIIQAKEKKDKSEIKFHSLKENK